MRSMELEVRYRQGGEEEDRDGHSPLRPSGGGGGNGRVSQLSDLYLEDEAEDGTPVENAAETRAEVETEEASSGRRMRSVYVALTRNRASLFLRRRGILPPTGRLAQLLTRVLVVLLWFGVMWAILGEYAHHAPINLNTNPSRGSCDVSSTVGRVNTSNITIDTAFNFTATNATTNKTTCQMEKIDNLLMFFWESVAMSVPETVDELSTVLDSGGVQCNGTPVPGQCVLREAVHALCPEPENDSSRLRLFDIEKGHFFGLIVLGIVAGVAGYLVALIRLPPLLGMLIAGVVLNNIPYIAVTRLINPSWSSVVRSVALTVILMRGGIAMDAGVHVCVCVCVCVLSVGMPAR